MGRRKKTKNNEDEFKKLEEEMVEKGSSVRPVEKIEPPSADDIEAALERTLREDLQKAEHVEEEEPKFYSPEEQVARKKKKKRIILIIVLVLLLAALGAGGYIAFRIFGPSTEKVDVDNIFGVNQDEVALIIDGSISDKKGIIVGGQTYIPSDIANRYVDDRIYVDETEKMLCYTTEEGTTDYHIGEEIDGETPLMESNGALYVAFDFAVKNGICEYKQFTSPNRIAIYHDREKTYTFLTLGEAVRLRTGPGKKYAYSMDLNEGDVVYQSEVNKAENEFQAVVTEDGVSGYIPMESIAKTESKPLEFTREPTSFTQKTIEGPVCIGWHNITVPGYTELPSNLGIAESVNVVSPTWIVLKNNKGAINSIANETYSNAVHENGYKLWPTVRDFPGEELRHASLLGETTSRRKLIKKLLKEAKKYNFDGINIDFERVKDKSAAGYLQFLRELTVECHKRDLIVSSDNYPIREFNSFYNTAEQGRIVDYCVFMAYDEHYAGSEEAGSVSSLLYVQDAIAKALNQMPKERIVAGLPFYTRLWLEKTTKNGTKLRSKVMGISEAENWLWRKGENANWDKETGQYYAEIKEGTDKTFKIWMENERSLKEKIAVATENELAGVAFWAMGYERAITWETIRDALAG